VGTVEPRKDLPTLVRAFDELARDDRDLHLVLAGPDGWGAEALDVALDSSGHRARIHRLGWVSDDHRRALVAGAAVLAYPSRYEGFGLPPLEALALGTPVVATRAGALPEVLGDAAEWATVGDPSDVARALRTVLDDPSRSARLLDAGAGRLAAFDWDRTVDGLVALYRRAAGLDGPDGADRGLP